MNAVAPLPGGPPRRRAVVAATVAVLAAALVATALVTNRGDGPGDTDAGGRTSPGPSDRSASPSPTFRGLPPLGTPRDVATGLQVPWGVAFLPDGTALVSERTTGTIVQLRGDGRTRELGVVPGVTPDGEGGLLGIAVAPTFADDRLVYAYFTSATDNRIVSMRLTSSGLGPPTVLLDGIPRAVYHDGGRLAFGPDGMLYATTGDHGVPELAQDRRSLAGKILRLTPSGGVPTDNPFPRSPVWSYGHRNVQGLAFDDAGRLWASEFGDSRADELNLIKAGANYGWPTFEGDGGRAAAGQGMTNPQVTWPVEQASPSGLAFADGVLYMGALRGERLWQIPLDGADAGRVRPALQDALGRIRTVAVAPSGDLWLTTSNTDGRTTDVRPGDDRVVRVSLG